MPTQLLMLNLKKPAHYVIYKCYPIREVRRKHKLHVILLTSLNVTPG
jgi:hypothetical protein